MTKAETARIIAILQSVWPEHKTTPELVMAYEIALGGEDEEFILGAVKEAIRTCRFFPRPVEILALADRVAWRTAVAQHTEAQRLAQHAKPLVLSGE